MKPEEPARLLDLATRILDGGEIDWQELERSATPEDRRLLDGLHLLASVCAAHTPEVAVGGCWGHFELRRLLGRGSYGDVYAAWDTHLLREVAIKLHRAEARPAEAEEPGGVPRWLEEARRLAAVRHPNLVTIHAAEEIAGQAGIAMEAIDGSTLEELMERSGTWGPAELAHLGIDLCRALAALHLAGLVHQDLKAGNVMRERGGRTVLMDLGFGGATPLYMAPELLAGAPPSPATDLYALGVLLFHLATGSYPHPGESLDAIRAAHHAGPHLALRDLRPDLHPLVVAAIESALSPDPADRPQSAGAFEASLVRCLPRSPSSEPVRVAARPKARAIRSRAAWLAVAAVGVAAVALLLRPDGTERREPPGRIDGPMELSPVGAPLPFSARAALRRGGGGLPLRDGDPVALGDSLSLEYESSESTYVYILNEDERGHAYLLFPLPGLGPRNPLPPATPQVLPGARNGRRFYWHVTEAGAREHLVILASRRRLVGLETELLAVARPKEGTPVAYPRVDLALRDELRGMGGLISDTDRSAPISPLELFADAPVLGADWDSTNGLWIRRMTLENRAPRPR